MAVFINEVGERYDSNVLQGEINQSVTPDAIDDLYISGQISSWSPREAATRELIDVLGFTGYQAAQIVNAITIPNLPKPAWLTDERSKQIQGVYQKYLGREADPGGLKWWWGSGAPILEIESGFRGTQEFTDRKNTYEAQIKQVFKEKTGRNPTAAELSQYTDQYMFGGTLSSVTQQIAQQTVTAAENPLS